MSHPNAALIERFYLAFQRRDADGMAACYHPDVHFSDPVFPDLRGPRATGMWRMLIARGRDLEVSFRDLEADDTSGRAHWDATYTYSLTRRKVLNRIDATFTFRDGLIVRHVDRFDLWRWTVMALGPSMLVLGWLPPVRAALRRKADAALEAFLLGNAAAE